MSLKQGLRLSAIKICSVCRCSKQLGLENIIKILVVSVVLKIFKSFVSNISWNNLFFLKVFPTELTFWTWKKKSSFYYSLFDLWFTLHSPVFSTVLYRKKRHANVILNPFLFKNPVFTLAENFRTLFSGDIKGNMMKIRYSVTEFVVPPDI